MLKNCLTEIAFRIYLKQLNKADDVKYYNLASDNTDILAIAEKGIADWQKC